MMRLITEECFGLKALLLGGGEMYFGGVRHAYYINYGMISIPKETGKPQDLPFV